MQQELTLDRRPAGKAWSRGFNLRTGLVLAVLLLSGALLPAPAILIGVLLMFTVLLYAAVPDLRPYVQEVLRIPVATPNERRTRLTLIASAGLVLSLSGTLGAVIRGQVRSDLSLREVAGEDASELVERSRDLLEAGNPTGAELLLLEVNSSAVDSSVRESVDDLLQEIRESRSQG